MTDYLENLVVHVFGDSAPALARMRNTAEMAGARILTATTIAADGAFAAPAQAAALLIELECESAGEAVVTLLDYAEREAGRGGRRSVVSGPAGLLDLIAARAPHPDVTHLCDAGEEERIAAVAGVCRPEAARLHDSGRSDGASFLEPPIPEAGEAEVDAAFIRTIIRARRLRDRYFGGDLFADPAWDMLLDLMAARLEGAKVPVSSLCLAAAVPATTALRWIKLLTERGLFVRVGDPGDGRRVHIELSEATARALGAHLRHARGMLPAVV